MGYYNQFSGIFKYGCGAYSFHDRSHYRFIFSIIFHNAEYKFVKDISDRFYEKVDDFVFCESYEKWDRSGALNITYLFAIMIGKRIGVVDQFMNQLIAPEYEELIAPIQSDGLFVLKDYNNNWGAIDAFTGQTIIEFGKYPYIWGFDHNHALVCYDYESDNTENTKRFIIDNHGKIIKTSTEYFTIFPFYNNGSKFIVVKTKKDDLSGCLIINRNINLLDKENPTHWYHPDIETVKPPLNSSHNCYGAVPYDKMDAYEDDPDALWNTD
jgi:hypothetical protein